MEQPYWDSLQECREMIEGLVLRTEQWIKIQPEMQGLLKLQNRAGERLNRLHPERPGIERRARRARLLYDGRCSRFARIWQEKGAFAQEAQNKFDDLSTVLIRDEVERRKAEVNWADPVSILKALQQADQRLEEFWQSRPGQSAAPAAGAESGGCPKFACYSFQPSGDANLTWSSQYVTRRNEKSECLHRTLWISNITKSSRRSQGGLPMASRRRPRSTDSVSRTPYRDDLRRLFSDLLRPVTETKQTEASTLYLD